MESPSHALFLHQQNDNLRSQLLSLSLRLSSLLPQQLPSIQVRDKTLTNTKSKLGQYEMQLKVLTKRQQQLSPSKVKDLAQEYADLEAGLNLKLASIRLLEKGQKRQERTLMSQSLDMEIVAPVDALREEVRIKQEQIARLETELSRGEEVHAQVKSRLGKAEQLFNRLLEQGAYDPDYTGPPVIPPDDNTGVTETRQHFAQLSKSKTQTLSLQRRNLQAAEAQWNLMQRELARMQDLVKEKTQQSRIYALQVSDLKRQLRGILRKNSTLDSSIGLGTSQTT